MLNLYWSITKRFLSVLVVFGKYFVSTKIVKKSKNVLPCSGDSVAGRTNRMPQSRVHNRDFLWLTGDSLAGKCFSCKKDLEYFSKNLEFHAFRGSGWRLVRRWKVQSRGVHRDFRGSVRDSLVSGTSSREKHLENFFKSFLSSGLAASLGDLHATWLSREKRMFCANWAVLKTFSVFPQFVCDYSLSSLSEPLSKSQCSHINLHILHILYPLSPIFK